VNGAELRFTVDGVVVAAKSGQTIIEACDDANVYIPRLCHRAELVPAGHCRLCTCVVNGRHVAACVTPVTHGIAVENQSPALVAHRNLLIEMLFAEGNHPCPFCEKSGSCDLQAVAYRLGIPGTHLEYQSPERAIDATHPEFFLDRNTCIQCGMCVRASRDVDRKTIFGFEHRGADFRIIVDSPKGLAGTGMALTDHAAAVCPVGAIVAKDTAYVVPYGERRFDAEPIGVDRA
jgi:[NiFe] hydrogenase diaphorase moiety small subunit